MPQFLATTTRGLLDVLEEELRGMKDVHVIEKTGEGVFFEGNWATCYRVNLHSRIASRVLKPLLDFTAYHGDEIYQQILHHNFTKYIPPSNTMMVEAKVAESKIHDQRFVALKVKDAIVDQFREEKGERPNVDTENPHMRIHVRGFKNTYKVYLDTSGDPLFMRGYRRGGGLSPLKENLAAGLIRLAQWDGRSPLVDPLCGSGTLLIEAALMALNIAPGSFRKRFAFMNYYNFEQNTWDKLIEEAMDEEKQDLDFKFFGSDVDKISLQISKQNAISAGVDSFIQWKKESVSTVAPPCPSGMVITNPPYGVRMGDPHQLKDVYRDLGYSLKQRFPGWKSWILSGNKDMVLEMKLRSSRKHFIYNGPIECRFLKYEIQDIGQASNV